MERGREDREARRAARRQAASEQAGKLATREETLGNIDSLLSQIDQALEQNAAEMGVQEGGEQVVV